MIDEIALRVMRAHRPQQLLDGAASVPIARRCAARGGAAKRSAAGLRDASRVIRLTSAVRWTHQSYARGERVLPTRAQAGDAGALARRRGRAASRRLDRPARPRGAASTAAPRRTSSSRPPTIVPTKIDSEMSRQRLALRATSAPMKRIAPDRAATATTVVLIDRTSVWFTARFTDSPNVRPDTSPSSRRVLADLVEHDDRVVQRVRRGSSGSR